MHACLEHLYTTFSSWKALRCLSSVQLQLAQLYGPFGCKIIYSTRVICRYQQLLCACPHSLQIFTVFMSEESG